jgi:Protein of unknown function (DUF3160)
METLQRSELALNDTELASLARDGFVVSDRHTFWSFGQAWTVIFQMGLGLYVTADAVLDVVHHGYDRLLVVVEERLAGPLLDELLAGMRLRLGGPDGAVLPPRARSDADLLLAVALSVLRKAPQPPVAGADNGEILTWVVRVMLAEQRVAAPFGSARELDMSSFKPRGHYGEGWNGGYYRALRWLEETGSPIAEDRGGGRHVLMRRQLELARALRWLIGPQQMANWRKLEAIQDVFVGPRGAMGPSDIDGLGQRLGTPNPGELKAFSDERVLEALDLDAARTGFALVGRRRALDTETARSLAAVRAREGLDPTPSAAELGAALFGGAGQASPGSYPLWLTGLGWLSMRPQGPLSLTAPATNSWARRIVDAQLAAWAQLRHDTMLYTEPLALQARDAPASAGSRAQLLYSGAVCAYPDVYVDPYPAFYDALSAMAARMQSGVTALMLENSAPQLREWITTFLANVDSMGAELRTIAEHQPSGEPPTAAQLAWINRAIVEPPRSCLTRRLTGWYSRPFYEDSTEFTPTVADCSPGGSAGVDAGAPQVPHIATGVPRLVVISARVGGTWRTYAGAVSTFSEVTTTDGRRLTDSDWRRALAPGVR